jgi:hypothetical protein
MSLLDRLTNTPPENSKANLKGGDKTLIEADGGLDLSADEKALLKARGAELGSGFGGYTTKKPYSSVAPK